MNFDYSPKEKAFLEEIGAIVSQYASQAGSRVEKPLALILKKLAATPYLRLGIEPVDGMEGPQSLMAAAQKFAAAYPSLYLSVEMSTRVFGGALSRFGSATQKEKFLTPLLKGELVGAMALSESSMNVENDALATTGTVDGDKVLVSGVKSFVINGPIANVIAVAGAYEGGTGIFFVPADAPGLTIGEPLGTLGFEGALISAVSLENCPVDKNFVIGPLAHKEAMDALKLMENQVLVGAALGAMSAAFEAAKKHAKEHKSGGRPIIAYQEVAFKLAEMLTMVQTCELLAQRACWLLKNNDNQALEVFLCAKVMCGECAEKVASGALQILSGSGFTAPNPTERAYRNAKFVQIAGVSTEIARVKIGDMELGYGK
jgi:alkylation response protein AidB-like acyl-CoA dehydrogenase